MIAIAWYAFVAVGLLTAAVLGAVLFVRWPPLVVIITSVYVLVSSDIPIFPPIASVAGTSVYFLDYFALVLFIASLPRLWRARGVAPVFVTCWYVLLATLGLSLLRGLAEHGVGLAGNEFRAFLYVVALLQWAFTLDWTSERVRQLINLGGQLLGWGLVVVLAVHVGMRGVGNADQVIVDPTTGDAFGSRPLNSGQALVLTLCALVCLAKWLGTGRGWQLASATVFFLCVVLAQNRSTWAAAIGGILVLLVAARNVNRTRLIAAIMGGALFATIVILSGALGDLIGNLTESLQSSSTFDARQDSWQALINQQFSGGDPLRILFGWPMGHGYDRIESSGRLVQYAPHNWYVTLLVRTGVVGLAALVVAMLVVLMRALRRTGAAAAFVTAMLLYGWAYSWAWYGMVFFGWATSEALGLSGTDLSRTSRTTHSPLRRSARDGAE